MRPSLVPSLVLKEVNILEMNKSNEELKDAILMNAKY